VTALSDAIFQNTAGNSQGQPLGLSWDTGFHMVQPTPPSGYSSVTGWGQVYQEAGASVSPNAASDTVQIADFATYVHLTNGTWVEVQSQAQNGIGGAHYVADFSGGNIPWNEQNLPDGSVSADAPPAGYNDHFWPGVRGTYAPGTVDGVVVEAEMKTNDPSANLVASVGADWWQTATSGLPASGFNPGVGQNDWVKLTTNWQTLYFSSLSPQQLAADPPPGLQTTTPPIQPAVTTATAAPGTGVEHVGATIALTLGFNEAVTVTGKPTLTLNDGSTATYVSGSGTNALVFSTTVAATNTATSALAVTGVSLASGASIKDASGVAANLSGAAKTFTGLQIDPTQPAVTTATAAPGTGVEHVGDTVALTLGFNEAVTVTGKPTLTLNDGSTATYVSGSGTNALVFSTTVAATNTATSALAITGVGLASGASIKDASGLAANLSGAATTFTGLQIDPLQPAVTTATAAPGTGVEHVGDTVALTLGFNEAVTVTGKPTLTLNDGSTATYVSGSGTNALVFDTTVAATDTATSALAVTGVGLASGASIKDASGVAANLSGVAKTFTGLQIDPTPVAPPPVQPAVTSATASPGTGVEHVGTTVALTLGFNEAVTVTGKPTLTLNDGSTATYVSGSGTNALIFDTTVAATDTATSALAVTGVGLASGASIKDASGVAANLSGAAKTFTGLQIDPTPVAPPPVQPAVTSATASPGTGVEQVGATIALTLGFNEAVTVTGKPTLTLNDGSTATYVSGSGTNALVFDTTVAATNTATSALAITGVGLASGASIKDASGVAANLSGAAKTFTGLQIDPTPVSTPPVTTPPVTTPPVPVLTVADHALSVSPGDSVSLGLGVSVPNAGDNVTVNIKGLPKYETITDALDHKTFSGSSVSLTAAEVNSGLTLTSSYHGHGHPTATLTVTATDSTGTPVTGAAQTITVKDPPATVVGSSGGATPPTGTGSGTHVGTGASGGATPPTGTGSGTHVGTGASGGATPPTGTGSGTHVGTGASGGVTPPTGTGSGTHVGTGASGGVTPPTGTGSGTHVGTGASGGVTPPTGTGSGTHVGTGASGGVTPPTGTGSGTHVGTGASGGVTPPTGTGSGTHVGTGASGGVTPPKVPVLSVADHSLSVSRGEGVALGIGVSVPNAGDNVKVQIAGLPKHETITDNLDHKTFRGSSITLTAAEVNSGLTLNTSHRGHGEPTATLTVTATDKTGTPVTSAAQTITLNPATTVAGSSGGATPPVTTPPVTTPPVSTDPGKTWGHEPHHGHFNLTQWFDSHPGFAPVAKTLGEFGASKSGAAANPVAAVDQVASAGTAAFARFNQMMAGDFSGDSHFAQVATASTASLQQSPHSLTKPLH
jgi:hypothetical protein